MSESGSTGGTKVISNGGIGFVGLLTLLFIALKLTGVINWSWWWVVSPLLISWGLALLLVSGILGLAIFAHFLSR